MTTEPPNEIKVPNPNPKKPAPYWKRLFRALWDDLKTYIDKRLSK
jgi:hypothetical protein